ncbi:MAG: exo-alpha-sialidase [Thaumarchaeota archaeon]|nr:exo-alpha-sialidase [Nitrososphaerota archaeon]
MRQSHDYGKLFDNSINLKRLFFEDLDVEKEFYLGPIAAAGENLYVTWTEINKKDGTVNSFLKKSSDRGHTFDANTVAFVNVEIADVKAIKNSVFVVATSSIVDHNVLFFTSRDNGALFENRQDLTLNSKLVEGNIEMTVSDDDVYITSQGTYWAKQYGGAIFRHSNNSGNSFSEPVNLSGNATVSIVKLAHDEKNLYVIWAQHGGSDGDRIYLRKSTSNGESFDEPVRLSSAKSSYFPKIAVNDKGKVFVMWAQADAAGLYGEIILAKNSDWGNTFGAPVKLATSKYDLFGTYIETQPNNLLYVIFLDSVYTPNSRNAVYFITSINDGESFEKPVDLNQDGSFGIVNPRFAQFQNHIYIVGDTGSQYDSSIFFITSDDLGETFNRSINLDDSQNTEKPIDFKETKLENNTTTNHVNFQSLQASQSKCTTSNLGVLEACSMQSFLFLGIFTSAVVGTVIVISTITLRRSTQNDL